MHEPKIKIEELVKVLILYMYHLFSQKGQWSAAQRRLTYGFESYKWECEPLLIPLKNSYHSLLSKYFVGILIWDNLIELLAY